MDMDFRQIENLEHMQRIYSYLDVLHTTPDIFNKTATVIKNGEKAIFDQLESADSNEKKSAIFAIVCLVEVNVGEGLISPKVMVDFAAALLKNVEANDETVARLASRAVIYLIHTSKTYALEILDLAFTRCDNWFSLNSRKEQNRMAGSILYRDLALFTCTRFFQMVEPFFNHIFTAIRDPKLQVRIAAGQALHAALSVVSQREDRKKHEWYQRFLDDQTTNQTKEDALHANLLLLNELLRIASVESERNRLDIMDSPATKSTGTIIERNPIKWLQNHGHPPLVESRTARTLVTENYYEEIIKRCFDAKTTKSLHNQILLLEMFPRIVTIRGTGDLPLDFIVDYVLQATQKFPQAFLTFGLISIHRPNDLVQKSTKYLAILSQQLKQCDSKKKPVNPMLFKSLCLVVRAQKQTLSKEIGRILPLLLNTGLSRGLTDVFEEIVEWIPALKTDVLDGLMKELYSLLLNRPLPDKLAPPTSPPVPEGQIQIQNVELIKLALQTLGGFDFQRHALQMFMKFIAQGYLVSSVTEIRLAAVDCCVAIVKPFITVFDEVEDVKRLEVMLLIGSVLDPLIMSAIVDSDVHVRRRVLKCFQEADHEFLVHLSQEKTLESLSTILCDEDYVMQEEAVGLLAQMSDLNPAFIFPKLHKVLKETIYNLTNSRIARLEVHSAKVVIKLATHAPKFVSPFMSSLLMSLEPHLKSEGKSVEVTVNVLNAISELALIGGLDVVKVTGKMIPYLLSCLKDSTSLQRREAALRALGNLCQSSGYVVEPYKDQPELLDVLLRLLKTELSAPMRRLTIKALGVVGALDPYTHKVYLGTVHSAASKSLALSLPQMPDSYDFKKDGSDVIQWINYERCTLTEYYPTLAIINLVSMLHDNALFPLYKEIVHAIMNIFKTLGTASATHVSQVIPQMLKITEESKMEQRSFFISKLAQLSGIVGQQMLPFVKMIYQFIFKAWQWKGPRDLRIQIVQLLEELGKALGQHFPPFVGDLCPYLLDVLENDNASDRLLTDHVLSCVRGVVGSLSGHIHVVLPPVLMVLDNRQIRENVRLSALETVITIARSHSICDRATAIMQTWLRCIAFRHLQEKLMTLLTLVAGQLWTQYMVYANSVSQALHRCKVDVALRVEYDQLYQQIRQNLPAPPNQTQYFPTAGQRIPIAPHNSIGQQQASSGGHPRQITAAEAAAANDATKKTNVEVLRRFWTAPVVVSRDEWLQWLATLRTQLLRQSSSAALRSCAELAEMHEPLAKELFNAAFMSVWTQLNELDQNELTSSLVDVCELCAFSEPVQEILNLAEFMDHSEKGPLPVCYAILIKHAEKTRAYAKALRYNELNILDRGLPNSDDCQTIIAFANKLNLEEASVGVVQYAEKNDMNISGRWYEKLGEWERALEMYKTESQYLSEEDAEDNLIHEMRCLEALGQWTDLNQKCEETLSNHVFNQPEVESPFRSVEKKQKIAQMAARGNWAVGNYEKMDEYVNVRKLINVNNIDGAFLRAVLAIRKSEFNEATEFINKVRDMVDSELTSMAAESYERAYGAVVTAQQLAELEEAIEYKMIPERRTRIAVLWSRRLQGCRKSIEHWQKILLVRSLVLSQAELRTMWVKFASMCRQQGKMSMSRRVLCNLLGQPEGTELQHIEIPLDKPFLALSICKQNWVDNHHRAAYTSVANLASTLHQLIDKNRDSISEYQLDPMRHLTAKCYLKLGDWNIELQSLVVQQQATRMRNPSRHPHAQRMDDPRLNYNPTDMPSYDKFTQVTLQHYTHATNFDENWYKAWHKLGTVYYNLVMLDRQPIYGGEQSSGQEYDQSTENHEAMPEQQPMTQGGIGIAYPHQYQQQTQHSQRYQQYQQQQMYKQQQQIAQLRTTYAQHAIRCFLRAIQLGEGSRLEDTLRLMMIWFDHGDKPEVYEQLRELLKMVPIETWLEVVPQLMGRMDSRNNVGLLVKQVVIDVARAHPQAIVYALTAATKSKNQQRAKVAAEILKLMGEERKQFVDQAVLISDELIRCAILWHEMWHSALEQASQLWFQERNYEQMMSVLQPLHKKIEAGQATMKEESFNQTYYRELHDAYQHCLAYERTHDQKQVGQAWDIYYRVFKRLSTQLRTMTGLELNYIAPRLLKAQNLEVCVPATYDPSNQVITIVSVIPHLEVIMSKQRPRKISMRGSDGNEYTFLLKGNEDLRQDERIMQLFGLINHLILRDPGTNRRNLSIQRYSIIPLGQNSGLIGWIPHCDTLHALIRDYRAKNRIPVSEEYTKMQTWVMDLEKLTLLQKVEIFDEALRCTSGEDLRQTLWMKSPNSEVWFDRRTNYTRSMACMSMVGYVLGLGDRHPSNLMLDRLSGKIVHIDFGDCFEVAMKRQKYPEKIPFRLTRMLVRAMEVTGVEGNYRLTCERVLRLLRNNHDSILAVLEAFVYDPVLNWRLTDASTRRPAGAEGEDVQMQMNNNHTADAIGRVKAKLSGRDFNVYEVISEKEQVNRLIEQATLFDNLCQCYVGWCPFW
ncbi:Serine/threonine-protein kinase TOR [Aphelenchoides besseyi]|nr:Serine/threonine-protein kinase TOR [Aphelenchoides besseyi]